MKKSSSEVKQSGKSSLVLGILSIFPGIFLSVIGMLLSVLTIIFGSVQLKKTRYGKIGLILGIISLIINIILSIFLFSFANNAISSYLDVKSLNYDDALALCNSKTNYYERTFCLGGVISANPNNPEVQSGKICSYYNNEEKAFCALTLAKINSNEKYCDILEEGDGKIACLAIARKDESLCNQLPLTSRARCLDQISKD